jgi:sRNA-binding regulator protein Hfq
MIREYLLNFSIPPLFVIILCSTAISVSYSELSAETIYFRDGSELSGKITGQDKNSVTIISKGEERSVPKKDISKILYKDEAPISKIEESELKELENNKIQSDTEAAEILAKAQTPIAKESLESPESKLFQSPTPKTTASGAFYRSLILPGWGQFYQGRPLAGSIYSVLVLGGSYAVYDKNRILRNAVNDYKKIEQPFTEGAILGMAIGLPKKSYPELQLVESFIDDKSNSLPESYLGYKNSPDYLQKEAVKKHHQELRSYSYGLATVWLWAAIDAYLFHPKQNEEILGFQENIDRGNISLGLESKPTLDPVSYQSGVEHKAYIQIQF